MGTLQTSGVGTGRKRQPFGHGRLALSERWFSDESLGIRATSVGPRYVHAERRAVPPGGAPGWRSGILGRSRTWHGAAWPISVLLPSRVSCRKLCVAQLRSGPTPSVGSHDGAVFNPGICAITMSSSRRTCLARRTNLAVSLAHEFQHLRQGDIEWEILLEAIKPIFFLNPAFHGGSARWKTCAN